MNWKPEFKHSAHPEADFEDGPFQYTIAQIDAASLEDVRHYLTACAQRLQVLGQAVSAELVCFAVRDIYPERTARPLKQGDGRVNRRGGQQ
jgi:hypothetical protein